MSTSIGGDDVASVEEAKMRRSAGSVNGNEDLVNGFDASTCSVDNVYDIFENEEEIITEDSIVWGNTDKPIWKGRVIIIT